MKIRTLIVDDEPHAREGIRIRLREFKNLQIVGECSSGMEAVKSINTLSPDLLFLDIQMPEMNGFEVLKKVTVTPLPVIIFVTAFDRYAIKAFDMNAVDYLLKPYSLRADWADEMLKRVKEEKQQSAQSAAQLAAQGAVTENQAAVQFQPRRKLRHRRYTVPQNDMLRVRTAPVDPHHRAGLGQQSAPMQFVDGQAPRRHGHRESLHIAETA